jgi:hypothetical protein
MKMHVVARPPAASLAALLAALLAAPLGSLALAGRACAETPRDSQGGYLGLSAGALRSTAGAVNPALQAQGLSLRNTAADDRDAGWKLYAGWHLGRHLSVEGGYAVLGRYRSEGQVVQDPGTVQATFKASDWNLAALAILPLGPGWDVFGKAGAGRWQTRLDTQGSFSGRGAQPAQARGGGPLLGLGARWRCIDALSARVEWERFGHIGQADRTGQADIDFLSLGLQYRF